MSIFIIRDANGNEINRINANRDFVELHYINYEEVVEEVLVQTHKETFLPEELHESFTSVEAIKALSSSNPLVRAQAELLAMKRNKPIHKDDEGYINTINLLEFSGVLTPENADDYRLGLPIYRLSSNQY